MTTYFDVKDATYKWMGIGIGIFGFLMLAFGVAMMWSDDPDELQNGYVSLGFCFPVLLVTSILLFYSGMKAERKRLEMEKLAAYLGAYRRIKIDALAMKLGISEFEAEKRILRCVRHRLLTGYIDRASDEFFNPFGMEGKMMLNCPNCGGTVEELVLDGDSARCPYCESILKV